jgi:hypothetical protein
MISALRPRQSNRLSRRDTCPVTTAASANRAEAPRGVPVSTGARVTCSWRGKREATGTRTKIIAKQATETMANPKAMPANRDLRWTLMKLGTRRSRTLFNQG